MTKYNIVITILCIFFAGVAIGLFTSKYNYNNTERADVVESYNLLNAQKVEIQKQFLHFYMNRYCDPDANIRTLNLNDNGILWNGMYCDRDNLLVLSDSFPPLPIAVIGIDITETEE